MLDYTYNDNKITETQTGLQIRICEDTNEARDLTKAYNLGKIGFSGFTPEFLMYPLTK